MTPVFKFYKKLERYALIKDSQFILNIPLELLREILEQANEIYETNSEIPNLSEIPTSSQTEISDEEIEKQALIETNKYVDSFPYPSEIRQYAFAKGFTICAKWYKEQLNNLKLK